MVLNPKTALVKEIIPSYEDGLIAPADVSIKVVDVEMAINRIKNISYREQWEPWEEEAAINRIVQDGEFSETRPAFHIDNMRCGVVIAVGEGCDCKPGDQVMFSWKNSDCWYSFWKDASNVEQTSESTCKDNKVYIFDGSENVLAVSRSSVIHIVPDNAIPVRIE